MHKTKIILSLSSRTPPTKDHYRPKITLEDLKQEVEDHALMLDQGSQKKNGYCIRRLKEIKSLLSKKAPPEHKGAQSLLKEINELLAKYSDEIGF